jgi:DUF2934 family protein
MIAERSGTMATNTTRRLPTDDEPTQADATRNESRPAGAARDDIAHRAYKRYEERGREPGHEMEDWLQAEREIEQRRSTE